MRAEKYSLILMSLLMALAIGCSMNSTPSPMDFMKDMQEQPFEKRNYKIKSLKKVDAVMSTIDGVQVYTIELGGEIECVAVQTGICKKGQSYELDPKKSTMKLMKTEKGWKFIQGYVRPKE